MPEYARICPKMPDLRSREVPRIRPGAQSPSGNDRTPVAGSCVVWWARRETLRDCHRRLLTGPENERADTYLNEDARLRFLLGAVMLRLAVAHAMGVRPGEIGIVRGCVQCGRQHGRPRLRDIALEVSVTHAGDATAVALTAVGRVGVDVECDALTDVEGLLGSVVAPAEARPASASEFLVLWTRKESVVKATGDGLTMPLTEVILGNANGRPQVESYGGVPLTASVQDLRLAQEYTGAVTVLSPEPVALEVRDATRLLGSAACS